jgi:hypothetical protein
MSASTELRTRRPRKPRFEAIDFAVEELGIESFADLDQGRAFGEHALYTIDRPSVRRGVLADARRSRPRNQLLTTIEQASERDDLLVLEGDVFDPDTITEIGEVDAVFMFNLLIHAVDPDWDRALELYAPSTSCFVIANPQWREGGEAVRLPELGRERYLDVVVPSARHDELFDRLDDWYPPQQRPHHDATIYWQWGIPDAALTHTLSRLGFRLDYERSLGPFSGAEAFVNKTFVYSRNDRPRPRGPRIESATGDAEQRARLADLERERDELRVRNDELARKLDQVLTSRSWRLTKPLRSLKLGFRRSPR